jgi:N-acyl-L-homoserine lactone synthetase
MSRFDVPSTMAEAIDDAGRAAPQKSASTYQIRQLALWSRSGMIGSNTLLMRLGVMIETVTLRTAHLFGDALADQHRFRYRQFIVRAGWDVPHVYGMEYDQFDTPAAVYLLWRDHAARVRGMVRLLPTTRPYMTDTLWPELAPEEGLPHADHIWENTRFAVDRDLAAPLRKKVTSELILASLEFGLSRGIERYLLISPLWVLQGALAASGLTHRMLRQTEALGRRPVASAYVPVSEQVLATARDRLGVHHRVSADGHQNVRAA